MGHRRTANSVISIHLMLLFIRNSNPSHRNNTRISIHLMLLFIETYMALRSCLINFNTSHVTVYLYQKIRDIAMKRYFNTSHVTVYLRSS